MASGAALTPPWLIFPPLRDSSLGLTFSSVQGSLLATNHRIRLSKLHIEELGGQRAMSGPRQRQRQWALTALLTDGKKYGQQIQGKCGLGAGQEQEKNGAPI